MFKEFLKEKLIDLLGLVWLEHKVMGRLEKLENDFDKFRIENKRDMDISNQAIRLILDNIKVDKQLFDKFKYYLYRNLPWYIEKLLFDTYEIEVKFDYCKEIYYKNNFIGTESSYVGELLDNINKIPKGKK